MNKELLLPWVTALGLGWGCAPAERLPVTVHPSPTVHRPDWLQEVPAQRDALLACVDKLAEPAFVFHVHPLEERLGVATVDGQGRTQLCVWSAEKGVEMRRPSGLRAKDVAAHPFVHMGSKEPLARTWSLSEPIRVDDVIVAWIQWWRAS